MNKSILAACAVVSLCGTTHGWSLLTFGQPVLGSGSPWESPDNRVRPSSGSLRLAEVYDSSSSAYVPEFNSNTYGLVTGTGTTWSTRRSDINNSSWFAGDSTGPDGAYTSGVGATNRPAWNAGYASNPTYSGIGTPLGPSWIGSGDGDSLVAEIDGGEGGWSFVFDIAPVWDDTPFTGMAANVSPLGGPSIMDGLHYDWAESVFVGRMTLTDPTAYLEGSLLVTTRDQRGPAEGFQLDMDGTTNESLKLLQVRDGASINLFIVEVPAPGVVGVMGLAGVFAGWRRRR
jgi:hypothetical protein